MADNDNNLFGEEEDSTRDTDIFGDEEEEQELLPDGSRQTIAGDGCIYDLSGRKVPVDQNGKHGIYVGQMIVEMQKNK